MECFIPTYHIIDKVTVMNHFKKKKKNVCSYIFTAHQKHWLYKVRVSSLHKNRLLRGLHAVFIMRHTCAILRKNINTMAQLLQHESVTCTVTLTSDLLNCTTTFIRLNCDNNLHIHHSPDQ